MQIMLWVNALSREMDHVESIDIEPSDLHGDRGEMASIRPPLTPESRARAESRRTSSTNHRIWPSSLVTERLSRARTRSFEIWLSDAAL